MTNPLYDSLFGRHAGRSAPFLHLAEGRSLSFAAFLDLAARMAQALAARSLLPGDRIIAQVEKSAEALALYAACVQAGLVFLPLNSSYTRDETAYFVADSGARLLVCDSTRAAELGPVARDGGAALLTLNADGSGSLCDAAAAANPAFEVVARAAGDLAALLYTSGTTGRPKGAMLTQGNLLSNARTLGELWRFTDTDVLLHTLPIFHTHGLFVATNVALCAGASMILLPKFELGKVLRALPKASVMMGVPTFYTRLLDAPDFTREAVAHMRLFISGSAPLLAETHAAFDKRTDHRILERYGMTETNMIASNPYEGERRAGTVGFPLPGIEVRICGPDGQGLPQGETGGIEVRGPNVFQGYWRMPEKTAEEFRPDGYFITGDLGKFDEDGYLHIVGRAKDLIISGGFNIYPKEIEEVLDAAPGIRESAVVGVPHPDLGEAAVGVLVALPGTTPDLEVVRQSLDATLARYKHPRHLVIVEGLPRNAMSKVQKNLLRAQFARVFGGG